MLPRAMTTSGMLPSVPYPRSFCMARGKGKGMDAQHGAFSRGWKLKDC
jgi:hypothetical protein